MQIQSTLSLFLRPLPATPTRSTRPNQISLCRWHLLRHFLPNHYPVLHMELWMILFRRGKIEIRAYPERFSLRLPGLCMRILKMIVSASHSAAVVITSRKLLIKRCDRSATLGPLSVPAAFRQTLSLPISLEMETELMRDG